MNKPQHFGSLFFLLFMYFNLGCAGMAYQHMNDPSRDVWQKPKEVIEKLNITPGAQVADVGAGGGYFTWPLAEAVGSQGTVYAVEINDTALDIIKNEMQSRGIANVILIRAGPNDAKLPEEVDLVFTCDTYHHMKDRVTYFRSLLRHLKPDGKVAILDFYPHGFFSGLLGHWDGQRTGPPGDGICRLSADGRSQYNRPSTFSNFFQR